MNMKNGLRTGVDGIDPDAGLALAAEAFFDNELTHESV